MATIIQREKSESDATSHLNCNKSTERLKKHSHTKIKRIGPPIADGHRLLPAASAAAAGGDAALVGAFGHEERREVERSFV